MAIPLLKYAPTSQNSRVAGYEVPGADQPKIFTTENNLSYTETTALIEAAYRQVFFHAFAVDRQVGLETQLRNRAITVRDFIRGLILSGTFKDSFYNKNSNYKVVEHVVNKVLGRNVYSKEERIAWSAVLMTKGLEGFVDQLLNSEEYLNNFGLDTVPYQRRRNLPGRELGEVPFNIKNPRYDAYYRTILGFPKAVYVGGVAKRWPEQYTAAKPGDPGQWRAAARGLVVSGVGGAASADIDYLSKVPYRKR